MDKIMEDNHIDLTGNVERFTGFSELYNLYRPSPPTILSSIVLQILSCQTIDRMIDLGCGTGLSTKYWQNIATQIIGIDPSDDMLQQAQKTTSVSNIQYQKGYAHKTNLSDMSAQLVTCSQSLHWMDPKPTFLEIKRITKSGGAFIAFDYDWPPIIGNWKAESAYRECFEKVITIENAQPARSKINFWEKENHATRMKESNCFQFVTEFSVHHIDEGNAARFIGILMSQGGVMSLLKQGFTEEEIGLNKFKDIVQKNVESQNSTWYWSSQIRLGIL
jgi:ubiquinone/menaquinone biosynthesis C-methylase UbiE